MQRANVVLSILSQKAHSKHQFASERCYRYFYNPDFYAQAYRNLYGSHTELEDRVVTEWIEVMKREGYQPSTTATPTVWDEVMQEVVRMIITALTSSYESRQARIILPISRLEAVQALTKHYNGAVWALSGDVTSILSSLPSSYFLQLLAQRIRDGRFIEVLRRILRAGILQTTKGLQVALINMVMQEWEGRLASNANHDTYVRYGAEWILFIEGQRSEALHRIEELECCMKRAWQRSIPTQLCRLHHLVDQPVRFLQYDVTCERELGEHLSHLPYPTRHLKLRLPGDIIKEALRPFRRHGKPTHHSSRLHLSIPQMITLYNREMAELHQSYYMATNANKRLREFQYVHYQSLLKTMARKENRSVKQIVKKYGIPVQNRAGTGMKLRVGWKEPHSSKVVVYYDQPLYLPPDSVARKRIAW
ncbi:group II intron reverse transcriptase/maturase [Mechercharimyces sp. CAU 1602]|uniref:group II intron reverse transcriptase/maturase n=1 Tax=Mechercharimyces sp. CAU 1602 TaxID=2973933 RepID=UPI0021622FD9|nr:group II intron reverse transcriptase/maturase [Mechercharimyces sp. CAU 1602]MCS1352688.1 hypothetical protein [Mechercharimyces sp. CAU 1602]